MLTRILAAGGGAFLLAFIYICPLFHGVPAPNTLVLLFALAVIFFFGSVALALLYHALTGKGPL